MNIKIKIKQFKRINNKDKRKQENLIKMNKKMNWILDKRKIKMIASQKINSKLKGKQKASLINPNNLKDSKKVKLIQKLIPLKKTALEK
jgi:hypothetical protein